MIQRRVVVPADAERLWRALTDPDEAGQWLGGQLEWTPEEGHELRFTPMPAAEGEPPREGRVQEAVPGRYLRFVWWPEGGGPESASEVAYELEPVVPDEPTAPPSTILTVEEAPLVPVASATPGRAACCTATGRWTPLDDLQLRFWAARTLAGALVA